ncbi:MAG: hypothetical protein ACPG3Z_04190 [Saprospiraceae bacterium]
MKSLFYLTTILILTVCCEANFSVSEATINKEISPHFIELETDEDTSVFRNINFLRTTNYKFLYLGKAADTIKLNYYVNFRPPPPPPPGVEKDTMMLINDNPFENYRVDWFDERKFNYSEGSKMEVKVDTSTIVKKYDYCFASEFIFAKAYPVIIKNQEIDTIIISLNYHIPLVLEAKDSLNDWRPIERVHAYFCGTGVDRVFLPPNEIAVTSVIIYQGDYETDLRLRLGENLSKPFKGQINYSQFEVEDDD